MTIVCAYIDFTLRELPCFLVQLSPVVPGFVEALRFDPAFFCRPRILRLENVAFLVLHVWCTLIWWPDVVEFTFKGDAPTRVHGPIFHIASSVSLHIS